MKINLNRCTNQYLGLAHVVRKADVIVTEDSNKGGKFLISVKTHLP